MLASKSFSQHRTYLQPWRWGRFHIRPSLPPGVNVTNFLRAAFLYEILTSSFSVHTFQVCTFWRKEICAKAARKKLMKLTPDNPRCKFRLRLIRHLFSKFWRDRIFFEVNRNRYFVWMKKSELKREQEFLRDTGVLIPLFHADFWNQACVPIRSLFIYFELWTFLHNHQFVPNLWFVIYLWTL